VLSRSDRCYPDRIRAILIALPYMSNPAPFTRQDIEFDADGETIRSWLYRPRLLQARCACGRGRRYSCVKEMHMALYAEVFAAAGMAVVVFDFRNLGASDGTPSRS